jgi:short-subunit dehydrogenase
MTQDPPGRGQTALITGAASGIGAALAARFAAGGFNLVLVSRRPEPLQALARQLAADHGVKAWVMPADLAQPGAPAELAAGLRRARRRIDVLVNNAGQLEQGGFVDHADAAHQQLIALNVAGLTAMLAQFVPAMVRRGQGRVLNVASIAAFQPVPQLAVYAATKAYVLSLTESLSEELKGTGVSVTALCPGITATGMLAQAQQASEELRNRLPDFVVGSADDVAAEGYEACLAGEVIRVPGTLNLAAILAGRAAPKWLLRRVSGAVMRRMT